MADPGLPVHAVRVAEPLPGLESTLTGGGAAWVFAYRDLAWSLAAALRASGEESAEAARAMALGMLHALEHAASRPRALLLRWEEHAERPAWTLAEIESLCGVRLGQRERSELLELLSRDASEAPAPGAPLEPALRVAVAQELRAFEARFGTGLRTGGSATRAA
jgi:hypothetical protein